MIELAPTISDMDLYIFVGTTLVASLIVLGTCAFTYLADGHLGQTEWWNTRQSDNPAKFSFRDNMRQDRQNAK